MGSLELHLASNAFLLLFFSLLSNATGFQLHLHNIFLLARLIKYHSLKHNLYLRGKKSDLRVCDFKT